MIEGNVIWECDKDIHTQFRVSANLYSHNYVFQNTIVLKNNFFK